MESVGLHFFLLVMFWWYSCSLAESDEASALLSFKRSSIEIDPRGLLNNWMSSSNSPCSWAGVRCSPANGHVHALDLSGMGLVGWLHLDDLIAMPHIQELNLHNNLFYGNLSYTITDSTLPCSLETVDLSANNFSDAVPRGFLASCTHLVSLNVSRNSISGGFYPFGPSIQQFDLSRNKISDVSLLNYSLSNCNGLSYLNLSDNKLAGTLLDMSSCFNLTVLDLSHNTISGEIPADFMQSSPFSLRQLDISHNNLSGDFSSFNFGECSNLIDLDLSSNGLNGTRLPPSLANCHQLKRLDISSNGLGDKLPTFWGNFSALKHLSLANNRFSGEIPPELALTCGTIVTLDISHNHLTGALPETFRSCSSLQILNLGDNRLSGNFIRSVVSTITSLKQLILPFNNITGSVPLKSLAKCSLLEVIHLGSNEFIGEMPTGFCSSLPSLQQLLLPNNFLSGNVPPDLGNCTNLRTIDLSFNGLSGSIPLEIWSLPKLVDLVMWANDISGEIPDTLCANDATLETLILSYNRISGTIPRSFTRCLNLIWVSLSGNKLAGEMPAGIGDLQSLAILQLGNNSLSGAIPTELGSCRNLIWLDLYSNEFDGPIPPSLASQTGLIVPGIVSGKQFAFLRNEAGNMCPGTGVLFEFEGIRPERLADFASVYSCPSTRVYTGTTVYSYTSNGSMIYLDLSYNSLSGAIPENFGAMMYLQVLNLGHNTLTGTIPKSLGGLKMAMALDLSHNHLTGFLPGELGTLTFLTDLDVSNNNLTGPIPSSGQLTTFPSSRYENNSGLCGLPLPSCGSRSGNPGSNSNSSDRRLSPGGSILIGIAFSVLILLSLVVILYRLKRNQKIEELKAAVYTESLANSGVASWKLSSALEPLSINVATFEKPLMKLTFAHLLEATNGFSAESLIGSGGFGDVYKAKLKDGPIVAVKKLIHVAGQGDREFTAEMETIGKIKHRNLVPLLGYCKVGDERLLVYEYMKFGSLDVVLHEKGKRGTKLDWAARKKIAIGSARGLAFLHHSCIPHIIHRDMKSSNVLLDENLEARVSDFGMARLMNALDTHLSVSTLAGTPGYVPPEYYQSFRCTTKGDVYSYGVVLLELLSGKKPIDLLEFGEDNNLVSWVKQMVKDNRSDDIFEPELMGKKSGHAELYLYLKIACQCLDDRPLRRPTMIQVMAMFKELQMDSDSDFLDSFSTRQSTIDESREKGP